MNNKFVQLVALAKSQKGWNKTQFIKEAKLSASQVHNLSNNADALYSCRQPARDKIASAIGIDVKYINDKDIPVEDFQSYLQGSTQSSVSDVNTQDTPKQPASEKSVSVKKTTAKNSSPAKKTSATKKTTVKKTTTKESVPVKDAVESDLVADQLPKEITEPSAKTASVVTTKTRPKPPASKKASIVKKAAPKKVATQKKSTSSSKDSATASKTVKRINKHLDLMSKLGKTLDEYTSQGGTESEFTQSLKQFADLIQS